ncbi:hypothetical protein DOTSEDRAFT_38667 [Dothistroma septosporum NZE10]|uniref:Uncharacterized protein n=1 Tax=Dothistroma septosporum (strain NZE10 / CBS 128990) TaxID=675120 RepID=M2XJ54_DOTSN|nr:hypothetical protein DOTSEDRAFT_38667 [Dothistroma septosporum NZE10]
MMLAARSTMIAGCAFINVNFVREEVADSEIVVKYKQSADDLYVAAAGREVNERPNTVAALLANAALRPHGSTTLPSWVRWRVRRRASFTEAYEALERCFSEARV